MDFDRKGLLTHILEGFQLNRKGEHGPSHWARVRFHALRVGKETNADLLVVELFAFIHDSKRLSEFTDPDHGHRAASFARDLNGQFFQLTEPQLEKLCYAMSFHSDGGVHDDATIQTCWDADRLDLGRVGIKPKAQYLSPEATRHIESAYKMSLRYETVPDFGF